MTLRVLRVLWLFGGCAARAKGPPHRRLIDKFECSTGIYEEITRGEKLNEKHHDSVILLTVALTIIAFLALFGLVAYVAMTPEQGPSMYPDSQSIRGGPL